MTANFLYIPPPFGHGFPRRANTHGKCGVAEKEFWAAEGGVSQRGQASYAEHEKMRKSKRIAEKAIKTWRISVLPHQQ